MHGVLPEALLRGLVSIQETLGVSVVVWHGFVLVQLCNLDVVASGELFGVDLQDVLGVVEDLVVALFGHDLDVCVLVGVRVVVYHANVDELLNVDEPVRLVLVVQGFENALLPQGLLELVQG